MIARFRIFRNLAVTLLLALGVSGTANAAVEVGDTVTCTSLGGFGCSPATVTVGPGSEFSIGSGFFSVDFSTDLLEVIANDTGTLGATVIQFGNTTTPFNSFTFLGQTGFVGLDASDVSLVGNLLQIDFRGTCAACGGQITAGDMLRIGFSSGAVPEPSTWAMMLVGFGAIGLGLRRRRRPQKPTYSYA